MSTQPTPGPWERALAIMGLISYRYRHGAYGFVMIGACDDEEALQQARLSISPDHPTPENLEVWNGSEYVPSAIAKATGSEK